MPGAPAHDPFPDGEHAAAMEAFLRVSEAAARPDRGGAPDTLLEVALDVLHSALPGAGALCYELQGERWCARLRRGPGQPGAPQTLPHDAPPFAQVLREARPLLSWGGDPVWRQVPAGGFSGALYPLFRDGASLTVLALSGRPAPGWGERETLVFLAVGRALELAFTRAEHQRSLEAQLDQASARQRVLEAFTLQLDPAQFTDPAALVALAQRLVLDRLPDAFVAYFEPQQGGWTLRALLGGPPLDSVRREADPGLPGAPFSLQRAWQSGEPHYQEVYDRAADGPAAGPPGLQAFATLPVRVNGAPRGLLGVGLAQVHPWPETDRATLETAAQQLGLALGRAEQGAAGFSQTLFSQALFSQALWLDLRRQLARLLEERADGDRG